MLRNHDVQAMAASTTVLDQRLSFASGKILRLHHSQRNREKGYQECRSIHIVHDTQTPRLSPAFDAQSSNLIHWPR